MGINVSAAKRKVNELSKKWLKIGEFEFMYKPLGGKKQVKIGLANAQNEQENITSFIFDSVDGWKGVKLKHLINNYTGDDAEELIDGFDSDLFDAFIGNNMDIIGELVEKISRIHAEQNGIDLDAPVVEEKKEEVKLKSVE